MDVFGGAPRFFAYPRPVVVQTGTDAVLKCQIGGDPRPAVIWERNNEKIEPQGRYRIFEDGNVYNLIISAVTIEDSGQYICKAKNSIGETYAAATLKVEGEAQELELREENKPRFLIKPLSTRAGRGEDAVFSCKLWGNPRPDVVWEKDGRKLNEIFESTHFSVGFQDGGWFQLKIFKTRAPDGGVYTCKARNEFGEALAGAVLLVDAGPGHEDEGNRNSYTNGHWKAHQGKQRRQLPNRLKDDTMSTKVKMFAVTEGKHAKFRCFVTGKPKPEIIWRKDGRLILSGRRYLLYEDREGYFTLKVLYCKQKDNGVYVCAASNTAGQTLSAVHLSVKEPPVRFKQPLIDLEVWERDLAVLECEVPEDSVSITWYLEDRRLQPGAKYGMEEWGTKRRLTIRDIDVDDDGIYLCEMPDGGRSIAEVAVKGTILRKLPRKVDVLEGENAAFCVEVENEEMDIHWYKDALELRETHQTILKSFGRTHILVFVNTMPQDSGLVTFLVGRSKTSSQLRVKEARHCPPSCPVSVQINTERANAALLSWVPPQDSRKNPPSGYVLDRQEVGTGSQEWLQCLTTDSATSVEILGDSVPCEADYQFRICSVNKYGKSNTVEFPRAVHLVPVARIQAPLQDALVPEGQDALFSIELSASVIGTWFLNGSQLPEDERYSMRRSRTHQSLRIRGVRDTDNGAEITFIAYSIRDSAALYIQAPLVKFSPMSEMDRNKFVEIGNPIVLYCELSDPAVPVHWYKNGVELQTMEGLHIQSEGTMRRIVIQSAEFSHSGVYCCDAIDDVIRFNVEVEAPPVRFSAVPDGEKNTTIEIGYPIVLSCELSDPSAQVHWYKDGSKLHPQTGVDILTEGLARKLIVHSAELFHSGLYCCKTKGDTISFSVDIKAPPVKFSAIPEEMRTRSIEAGCPIVLQCVVSDPEAHVCWYKDETQLISNSGLEIQSEGNTRTLVVQSAELSNSGVYRCTTKDDTMEFQVEIKAPLLKFSALSEGDQKKTVMTGSPIALQCELSDPTGQVSWFKDGTKLLPQNGVDIQSEGNVRGLVVPSAERAHTGIYRCESKDDDIQFAVEVKALPLKFSELQETDKSKYVQEGSPIVLSCELSHDASAHVDWYKDGMKLLPQNNMELQSDGQTRTLLIHSAEHIHCGTYECSTSDDTITFKVDVEGRSPKIMPIPLSEKYKMITMGGQIVLQCEVSDPVAQVSWFKDEVELFCKTGLDMKRDGSQRKLMIHSAKVSDSGLYSCSLADDVVTFQVDVEASPVRFSALPDVARNTFVEAGCPLKLQCEVSEPAAQVYWHKNRKQLPPKSDCEIQTKEKLRALVIASADVRHSGVYSCEAADDHIEFKVDVAAVPETERSKSVEAGSPINLQCETSDPTSQTGWCEDGIKLSRKSGINIESEGNKRTLIKSASSSCSGGYSYKTDDDSDFNDFYEEVKESPVTFAEIPEEDLFKSVVEQEQLVLSCEVSRAGGVVQWYKDGAQMQPCDNITMQVEDTKRNLTIHAAQPSDTGTYTCRAGDNILMYKVNIREPPVMIIHPKEDVHLDRHVPEEIILSCELSRANGVVSWYKDGQKLQESENIKLKIEGPYRRLKIISSGVEDSGEYVCDTADASIFFHLSITEPPVRIVSPSQSQMELCQQTSERMVLSCEISRTNAVVRWYRDGLEVEENENLILEVDGVYRRLIIPETTVQDSAEYVCDTADDSMTFFVNIAEAPVRFVRPRKMAGRVDKVVGETLVLDCEVSRSNAEVTWKKNGEEVEDSRNITILEDGVMRQLTVHSLTMEDAGQYVCDAKDDVMDFHVEVQELPVKIIGKTDTKTEKQFLVSDDIILVCELSRSNASVSWYKANQLVDDTERYCSEEQGVFRSLVVLNAGLEDSGEYTCDAVDDKMVFYITVKEPQVSIIGNSGHPEHHMLVEGDDLILECEVSRPNATVQWLWNGEILKPDTRIQIDSHDVVRKLVLTGLQPSDSGEYICDAMDDKLTTIVEVQELPVKFENKKPASNITANENESVTLCATVSREITNVRWLKDGQLLNRDNIHISSEGNTYKLTINPLQLSDSGEYVCDINTDQMQFSLLVKGMKMTFTKPLENIVSLKGSILILRCEISKPKGDVQWLKDGHEISPSRRHTIRAQGRERSFTIQQLEEEDAGEYACESTDDRTSATVNVQTPRVVEFIAELCNITVREGEDAVFKCVVSPEDTRLVWRLNGKQVAPNERTVISSNGLCHMLCIHNCMVSDSGRVTADAEGTVSEAELQIQEQQVLFTKKMTPVVAEEYSEATLEVEVGLDSGEVQWMRQGVLIHPGAKNTLKHKGRKHSLTIHRLAISDRGSYSCETLHDRTQAQLTVEPRRIKIKRGLTDIKTTERETASFEVELSHSNVPGTWMRNTIKLKPTNHYRMSAKGQVHSLTIYNLSVEDTGTFTFSVENLKTTARLVVKEPPVTIFRKLEDQKFPDGAVISIECELSRHNVDVKWMKNGVELKPGKELRIYSMGRKRFLQIMKCHVSDSGIYTCDAGDTTTSCTVEVYERELLILKRLQDVDIQEDQNAVFVCEISVEDLQGEWYKNGERIQPTSTIKLRQEGTKHFLLMCNVKAEDSGEIKFVTRHVESVARLEVEELPVNIVKPLEDTTALEKTRVLLDCTVSNPRCSIRWYKGSNVILPSERFEICSEGCYRKLIMQQVALDDAGTYSVQVGEYTCSAKLTVEAQPQLLVRELQDVEVKTPGEACFECEVSVPVLKAPLWTLNGEPLLPSAQVLLEQMGTVHRLTLTHTSPSMGGEVEFTSGRAKSRAQLRVISEP
ncbi:obscurin-like protein 1 isoform X1 [Gymnodraco acuticeps]|uniref:Obscurin-like protein 1 n=1 Tax=Gymnodraco acuticeps TaxID=8218 RepID=A0A6P8ULU8_GYMAC|nr:obscurin-like protein 1 isoform X1 [Gymnodraco acuticeps]XP_034077347.1 obscurin-like protein 1 isoform X1 [Gymnodraco acuticeps]